MAALVLVPIYFNPYTQRIFEEDKALLLQALAAVVTGALAVYVVEEGRVALRLGDRPFWRIPVCAALVVLTVVYVVSAAFSIDPLSSWSGNYDRGHGVVTWLACIALFFGGVASMNHRGAVDRTMDCVMTAGLVTATYSIVQAVGLDPIAWAQVSSRPTSTAGNPIFSSAFLIMVYPLALVRVVGAIDEGAWLRSGATLVALAIYSAAIALAGSRGPAVALVAGVAVLLALLVRLRWVAILRTVIVVLVSFAVFAAALLQLRAPAAPTSERTAHAGTSQVRVLIWRGVADLIAANPARIFLGQGPEMLHIAFPRYYPSQLGQHEQRDVSPDRAHNQTLDMLAMTGAAGCLSELVFFFALFFALLRGAGLVDPHAYRRYAAFCVVGGSVGLLLPLAIDGSLTFAGLGLPAGALAGLLIFVLSHAPPARISDEGRGRRLLALGVLAGAVAHFAEIQVGIAIVSTRLCLFAYAAIALALVYRAGVDCHGGDGGDEGDDELVADSALQRGLYVALALVALTFGLFTPTTDATVQWAGFATLFSVVWFVPGVFSVAGPGTALVRTVAMGRYTALSVGSWIAFCAVYLPWITWQAPHGPGSLVVVGEQLTGATSIFFAAAGIWIVFHGSCLRLHGPSSKKLMSAAGAVTAVLAMAASGMVVSAALRETEADVFAKLGGLMERDGNVQLALRAHERAYEERPGQGRYAANLARSLGHSARRAASGQVEEARATMQRADRLLTTAAAAHPLDADYPANLARLHRAWASAPAAEHRDAQLDRSAQEYRKALEVRPYSVMLWNELASLHAQRRQWDEADAAFARSLALDDRYATTYWTRAEILYRRGDIEAALADYERATEVRPSYVDAWSGRSVALARLGRFDEAIEASEAILALRPDDFTTRYNLARLFRATGRLRHAVAAAERAGDVAPPNQRSAVVELLAALRAQLGLVRDDSP